MTVSTISPNLISLKLLDYNRLLTILTITKKVEDHLLLHIENIRQLDILFKECKLINGYCVFYIRFISLERILNIEIMWYSLSTSCLESDVYMRNLLFKNS